jgi:hypothetical protein
MKNYVTVSGQGRKKPVLAVDLERQTSPEKYYPVM